MNTLLKEAQAFQQDLVAWRRQLHQNPELSMELPETCAFVMQKLTEMGYSPKTVAKTGVTAIAGKGGGKCFMLRADMDALPITEEAEVSCKSTNGSMHACGHDFHTTMLLGAARLLKAHEDEIEGQIKLLFQPGEETLKGAKAVLADGILQNPTVDAAAMFHVAIGTPLPSGLVIVPGAGTFSAASDWFELHIKGKGGHGAMPEQCIDPINVMCQTYNALQEIRSRELASGDAAVITVGHATSGTTSNVIPDTALMEGTIRTFDPEVRAHILKRIPEIATGVAQTFRANVDARIIEGCPCVVCDEDVSNTVRQSLQEALGASVPDPSVLKMPKMNGSEDFSFITQEVPSVMMIISAGSTKEGYPYGVHHPKALFNEDILCQGAAAYAIAAMGWLQKNK